MKIYSMTNLIMLIGYYRYWYFFYINLVKLKMVWLGTTGLKEQFKGKFHWFSCFLWLPDSLKHFWGIIKLVSINAYPRDDNHAYVLFTTLFLKSTRAWAIKVVPRAPTIITAPRRKSTWRWNRRTWWGHAFCALRFRAWKFAVDSSNAA